MSSDRVKRAEILLREYEDGERDFGGAQLGDANPNGTDLHDVDLSGADPNGAILLDAGLLLDLFHYR